MDKGGVIIFTSIFKKLLVTYLAVIVAVIATLSLVLSVLYTLYAFNEKKTSLLSAAFEVNQSAKDWENRKITQNELSYQLDSLGSVTNSKIYIVRVSKEDLKHPETLGIGENLKESYLLGDLSGILGGNTVFRNKQYSKEFDMYVVFTGVPWRTDKGIEGAILLYSPVNRITKTIADLNLTIWLIAAVFLVISAVVIYLISMRISRPIKKMGEAALKLASGEAVGDIEIKSRDEIGKLAGTFNYMRRQLIQSENVRREFIANVSHDLRTPLTSLNGFLEGMRDGIVKPEDYGRYLGIMQDEVNRLMRMTGDILNLSKIQSGAVRLNKETLSAKDIVEQVTESLQALAAEKEIGLSAEFEGAATVYADPDKLKQILINIVENAIKYTDRNGKVAVRVIGLKDKTQFSVQDTGIGIPEEELPFIFDKFYRVDKSRPSTQGGTGLGLNIAKSLVELHGGRIGAKSEPGRGTEILFELPKS